MCLIIKGACPDSVCGDTTYYNYDNFGNIASNSGESLTPFAYVGGIYEQLTGLTRFGFRDYDATMGRWTANAVNIRIDIP
jgi:hypothetical protein